MAVRRLLLCASLLLLAAPFPAGAQVDPGQTFSGKVTQVNDGDTYDVQRPDGHTVTVRLYGADAPETAQPYGRAATNEARAYVGQKTVHVDVEDVGRYGRAVARIEFGVGDLGAMLIRDGMAWHYEEYAPNETEYARLERQARNAGRGLWSEADPVPPWEWRDRISISGEASAAEHDCPDFSTQAQAQRIYELHHPGDPYGLDRDGDGEACEWLPERDQPQDSPSDDRPLSADTQPSAAAVRPPFRDSQLDSAPPSFIPDGEFWEANLAFNTPSTMVLGRVRPVELVLSPSVAAEDLQRMLEDTVEVDTAEAMVVRQMRAELTGANFTIEAVTSELQDVTVKEPTVWKWQVEPKRTGNGRLDMSLTAEIEEGTRRTIETFRREIEVEVTWGQLLAKNWQWLVGTVLIPLFLLPVAQYVWKRLIQQQWSVLTGQEKSRASPD